MEKIGRIVKIRSIAVTGIPSSGKSAVCEILSHQGAFVVKADDIVHNLLSTDPEIVRQVVEILGEGVIENETINRGKVAAIVFRDKKKLKDLEALLHPRVIEEIKRTYEQIKDSSKYKAFVVEIPLLFEMQLGKWFDTTITVIADDEICKNRFMNKGFTKEQFDLRKANHLSQMEKSKLSDITITNNGTIKDLEEKVVSALS